MNSDFDRQQQEPNETESASLPVAATDSRVAGRRKFLFKLSIAINAVIGLLIATPVIRFLLGPLRPKGSYDSWIALGKLADYPEGSTLLSFFRNPTTNPWDGETGNVACYVRRESKDSCHRFRRELRASWMPGALVPAIAAFHVSLPRRRLLRRRLSRCRSSRTRIVYICFAH